MPSYKAPVEEVLFLLPPTRRHGIFLDPAR